MERTQQRKGFGWETPWDLYCAIEKLAGSGRLTYEHDTEHGWHEFHWFVGGRAGLHYMDRIDERELMACPVAQIAYRFVSTAKAKFQRLVWVED